MSCSLFNPNFVSVKYLQNDEKRIAEKFNIDKMMEMTKVISGVLNPGKNGIVCFHQDLDNGSNLINARLSVDSDVSREGNRIPRGNSK